MSEGEAGKHWLVLAMERAQIGGASQTGLPADTPPGKAWTRVAELLDITEDEVTNAVAKAFRLELADLSASEPEARALLPERHALAYGVLPISYTDRDFVVATAEPLDFNAEREIGFLSGRNTLFVLASPSAISEGIQSCYRGSPKAKSVLDNIDFAEAVQSVGYPPEVLARASAEPRDDQVGGVIALIFYEAVKAGVSEVQLTPRGSTGQVLLKDEGGFTTLLKLPIEVLALVADGIGVLAELPEESEASFGGLDVLVDGATYAVSVHTVPGLAGHLLLRISTEAEAVGAVPPQEAWHAATTSGEGHILVVDDDSGGRMLMRTVLEKNGFTVSEADDGTTALPLLQLADDIDAVLLDLMMTTMDGLEVLLRVRKSRKTAGLPVVILTASKNPEDEHELLRAGADDYLRKPVDPHQLVNRMKAVLRRSRSYLD